MWRVISCTCFDEVLWRPPLDLYRRCSVHQLLRWASVHGASAGHSKWNGAVVNVNNYTCVYSAETCQYGSCEKGRRFYMLWCITLMKRLYVFYIFPRWINTHHWSSRGKKRLDCITWFLFTAFCHVFFTSQWLFAPQASGGWREHGGEEKKGSFICKWLHVSCSSVCDPLRVCLGVFRVWWVTCMNFFTPLCISLPESERTGVFPFRPSSSSP